MQKPMLLALLFCRKNYCWRIYGNLHSPAFKIPFSWCFILHWPWDIVILLILLTTLLLQKPHSLSMYLLWLLILSSPLYSMFDLLHIVHNTLLQFYSKRCNIGPFLVTFMLRILLLQHSQLHSCLLQKSKLTQLRINVQNNWLALA